MGTYTYNASGASSTRPHAVASTRLTTGGTTTTTTYSYDANGNLVSGGGRTLTWDAENRPTKIVKGGVTTTFGYDGDGGRVKKTVSTAQHATVYIGQLYVCQSTACTKLIYAGSQRVAMVQVKSGATSYFHGDHLGSTSALTNASGTAEEHNSYQPYGDLQTHTGTSDVAYKYTGQERDASTELYFYQARYYDPVLGRFLSPDTLVQSPLDPQALNRYAYARNNPLRYTDPSGHFFKSIFKFFKRISHGVNKFMHRALGKAAPIVMTAVAVVASVYTFGASSVAAKGAIFQVTTAGLTSQAAIGTQIVAMSPMAGVIGSTAGGLAAGFVGGVVGSGGDLESGLIGSVGGGVGGLATGLGSLAGAKYGSLTGGAVRVAGRGVAGGTTSALRSGRFEHGFGFAAGFSLARLTFQKVVGEDIFLKPGGPAALKEPEVDYVSGANNFGFANTTPEALADPGLLYEGSFLSRVANLIPGLQPTAGFHDVLTGQLARGFSMPFAVTNVPTMPLALGITYGAVIDEAHIYIPMKRRAQE